MSKEGISLKWYVLRRILASIPIIFAVATFGFVVVHAAPGDPISYIVGGSYASEEYIEMMRVNLGLDKPLIDQYWIYLGRLCRLDLGYSIVYGKPVLSIIWDKVPLTALLIFSSATVSYVIAILLAVFVSTRPHSFWDKSITTLVLFGFSMPAFWLGLVLMYVFAFRLRWFPLVGWVTAKGAELTGLGYVLDVLHHLVLPAITLGMFSLAIGFRITRTSMIETMQENFIVTALSKGLDEKTVIFKHALRNSLRSVITMVGMTFGWILTGAILIETVFALPGLGMLTYSAIASRDYPLILGLLIVSSFIMIMANLVTDIVYALLDPRVRYR